MNPLMIMMKYFHYNIIKIAHMQIFIMLIPRNETVAYVLKITFNCAENNLQQWQFLSQRPVFLCNISSSAVHLL